MKDTDVETHPELYFPGLNSVNFSTIDDYKNKENTIVECINYERHNIDIPTTCGVFIINNIKLHNVVVDITGSVTGLPIFLLMCKCVKNLVSNYQENKHILKTNVKMYNLENIFFMKDEVLENGMFSFSLISRHDDKLKRLFLMVEDFIINAILISMDGERNLSEIDESKFYIEIKTEGCYTFHIINRINRVKTVKFSETNFTPCKSEYTSFDHINTILKNHNSSTFGVYEMNIPEEFRIINNIEFPSTSNKSEYILQLLDMLNVKRHDALLIEKDNSLNYCFVAKCFDKFENYENIETYGDALIKSKLCEYCLVANPKYTNNDLTNILTELLSGYYMSRFVDHMNLYKFIKSKRLSTFFIKEDVFESFVGALYISCRNVIGFKAHEVIYKLISTLYKPFVTGSTKYDVVLGNKVNLLSKLYISKIRNGANFTVTFDGNVCSVTPNKNMNYWLNNTFGKTVDCISCVGCTKKMAKTSCFTQMYNVLKKIGCTSEFINSYNCKKII